ncbi:hypothetical protein AVEN_101203-1 [Araneus ventricosus]|uniref:Helitron helicase-like domain-containing protein n=1 Tax=Araneus ventricosus TaxID=182803 RepID=A0A4Y2K5R5_ARAVE|nr:hypothetical protein AVEN_101203-1 [Araneus ventricosus]
MNETDLAMDNCTYLTPVKQGIDIWRIIKSAFTLLEKLDALLRSINPFAESYLQMHQLMQSNPAVNVKMVFYGTSKFRLAQCSDPMVYPLLFLNGECGWNSNLEHVEERRSAKRVRVT